MTEQQESMLDELLAAESGLSGWEMDFLESLDSRRNRSLTERQVEKLISIWTKVVG